MIGGAKGIGIGIDFGIPNQYCRATSKPYIEKDVLDSLRVVASAYGKSNDDADRSIVKNLVDASNPFIISNAAFKLNSGFGKYGMDFLEWKANSGMNFTSTKLTSTKPNLPGGWLTFRNVSGLISETKVKVSGAPKEFVFIGNNNGADDKFSVTINNGVYTIPEFTLSSASGFYINNNSGDWSNLVIEQIPSFEGAFVTDGIDDLIKSTKSATEMLDGSNEVTVVSMIHQIKTNDDTTRNNWFFTPVSYLENRVVKDKIGKTGIYGYTSTNVTNAQISDITPILGDKNDYTLHSKIEDGDRDYFTVEGFQNQGIWYVSSIAWYWTIIANKVLTTDQINQVIAYFNLDRTLNPDILCNTIKQGITNENHAEFGDKLIDFSGNGRDIQLNNIAWKGNSGIGNYPVDFTSLTKTGRVDTITHNSISYSTGDRSYYIVYKGLSDKIDTPAFKIKIKGISLNIVYFYINSKGIRTSVVFNKDGVYELPTSYNSLYTGTEIYVSGLASGGGSGVITIIPSNAGALCLDGVSDFGKVTGMPVYKDYTFIIDRQIISIGDTAGIVASKSEDSTDVNKQGAFLFEYLGSPNKISAWSFYKDNGKVANTDFTRGISYQSTYSYNGKDLTVGTSKDSDKLWLGTIRDRDPRFFNGAIYSLMSFPYSMSEFLIERQLKKHKLGTLYPDMVEFRPIVKSNIKWNIIEIWQRDKSLYRPAVNDDKTGIYLKKDSAIGIYVKPKDADEVTKIVVNGTEYTNLKINSNGFYYVTLPITKSPQKINITIDEYIRYEDIKQPYPLLFEFTDENGNLISWGGKAKVGNTITRTKSVSNANILAGLYNTNNHKLNGKPLEGNSYVVEKQMVFTCTATYLLDDNEPKCILSPRLLRIPNSSYKILGHIPDISGHGNHGKINNSAYAEGSGVNEDGSYQFDGVDDLVTIPTMVGGKQVLMKVNWQSIAGMAILYDQRTNGGFAIFNRDYDTNENKVPAYRAINIGGNTYIDGILNEYIYASQLQNITHNIVELYDPELNIGTLNPKIGSSYLNTNYAQMSLYDFMLFDEISTDDKIQELNEYVGIEAKVELPPYYWDAYGKTNLDADKATIQQRGVAIGDYDLTNYNHAYEGMSGYNGYPVVFGANKTWESLSGVYGYTSDVTNTTIHVTHAEHAGNGLLFSYVKKDGALANIKEIPAFRVTIGGLEGNSKFGYRYLATEDATGETLVYLGNGTHELAKSFAPTEALLDLTRNVWVGIFITPMVEGEVVFDCDITIEVLPEYENGLAYDGITDYSKNANIPAFTNYTYIFKRTIINIPTNAATLLKGAEKTNGGAFIADYGNKWQFNFGQYNIIQGIADGINWQTVNSFNGTSINKGENTDDSGITVAKISNGYTSMVFYKLILYPKTISLLEINFLKNLMEKDEIIDLTNPIFIQ